MSLQEVVTGRSPVAAGRAADPALCPREALAAPHADPGLSHLPGFLFHGSELGEMPAPHLL